MKTFLTTLAAFMLPLFANAQPMVTSVDVFTVDGMQFGKESEHLSRLANAPVYVRKIDGIFQFETQLSVNLPQNEELAYREAMIRLSRTSMQTMEEIYSSSATAINLARSLGVTKVPAVVFNRKWVVYGLDPVRAYEVFEQKQANGELRGGYEK